MMTFRRAFSLIELMLVVVIIGIVYAMALSSFKAPKKESLDTLSLKTLPQYLRKNFALTDAKLVCFKPCGKCQLMVNGELTQDNIDLFSSSDVKAYTLDIEGFATQKEFVPHDISDGYRQACFILHKRANDSIAPIVLENEGRFIYYRAGYEAVEEYDSLASIQTQYQNIANMIRDGH